MATTSLILGMTLFASILLLMSFSMRRFLQVTMRPDRVLGTRLESNRYRILL